MGKVAGEDGFRRFVAGRFRGGIAAVLAFLQPGREPESAALAGLAAHAGFPAHRLSQAASNDQAQAGAAEAPADRVVGLLEGGEQPGQGFRADADAGVLDVEADQQATIAALNAAATDADMAAFGELDGIAQVIEQSLFQAY